MHGLSTILSLIFKLLGKLFRVFGINAILVLFFVIELAACIGYASEMYGYDSNRRDYEIVGIESVEELGREDPLLKKEDILASESDHFYLVRIKVHNRYSESLSFPSLGAETEDGDIVIARRLMYYDDGVQEYNFFAGIPEGTQMILTYVLQISDHKWEDTESVKLYDFTGKKEESIVVPIPK